MKRNFSKRVAAVLLAINMVINCTGVSALAATGTASDPVLGEESSEENRTASKKTYEKVSEEKNEKNFDVASPSNATASPSNATRNSSDIMPISQDTTMEVSNYGEFRTALADNRYFHIDTVILTDDITWEDAAPVSIYTRSVTIDLNHHNINRDIEVLSGNEQVLGIQNYELTLKNGTISATALREKDELILVDGGKLITENMKFETNGGTAIALRNPWGGSGDAEVTLSADSSIEATNGAGIAASGSNNYTINVEGKINVQGDYPAIIGKAGTANTDINIQESAEITGGIVQMSSGNVVIEDGAEIESGQQGSAVSIANGMLTVKDGATIKATSPFEAYQSGTDDDLYDGGSAIFVEPSGNVTVTIEGGTIISAEGPALYAPREENADLTLKILGGTFEGNTEAGQGAVYVNGLEKFISGGTYNTDIGQYVADNVMVIKVTHSGETWSYVGDDAVKKLKELVSGDTVEFQGLGGKSEFELPVGVIVTNRTGEDITVNGIELSEGNTVTAVDKNASLTVSVSSTVTNHLEDFDETLAKDWDTSSDYAEPGADIDYTVTIRNAEDCAAPKNLVVKARIPAGTTLTSADDTYEVEDGCVVWKNVSVGSINDKTLSFKVKIDDPASEVSYPSAATLTWDNNKNGTISSTDHDVPTLAYGIVYELNGGLSPDNDDVKDTDMLRLDNGDHDVDGTTIHFSISKEGNKIREPRPQPDWDHVIFAGWSLGQHEGVLTKKPDDLLDEFDITGHVKLYAVWAKDENEAQIPDFEQASRAEELSSDDSDTSDPANTWSYDATRDKWTCDNRRYKNRWAYLFNPYAVQGKGRYDWFFFDKNGEMVTGWFTDADGLTYYLNETADGTRGCMVTGWNWIADVSGKKRCYYFSEISDGTRGHLLKGTITPDGYAVDTTGAWAADGKVAER